MLNIERFELGQSYVTAKVQNRYGEDVGGIVGKDIFMMLLFFSLLHFRKIVETCIYYSDLVKMKDFYVNILGLEFVSEEKDKYVFLKAGQSMLLIFNPNKTLASNTQLPSHGALPPPSIIHFALEINEESYDDARSVLNQNNIKIEKEVTWEKNANSIYFRDPAGNLVEIITPGSWPVDNV